MTIIANFGDLIPKFITKNNSGGNKSNLKEKYVKETTLLVAKLGKKRSNIPRVPNNVRELYKKLTRFYL